MKRFFLRPVSFWKAVLPYLILAVISAVYLYPFVRTFNEAPDSGVYLNGAELVSRGAVPSRDFVELQGPGSFVWLGMFFRLFGTTVGTAQAVLVATGVGLGLLAFWLSRRLGATGFFATLFVVMISVPLSPINSPHYDSNLFALGALAVFLLGWDEALQGANPAVWKLVLAAALCGITTCMIQQKGFYLAVALVGSLVWLMRGRAARAGMIFGGVYAAVALFPFAVFAVLHALPDVLYANYVWPMSMYSGVNAAPYGFPIWQNLWVTWNQQGRTAIAGLQDAAFSMPFLVVAVLPLLLPLVAWWSGRQWFGLAVLPYWLASYALWLAELHRLDMGHLRNGAVLMAVLFFAICEVGGNRFVRGAGLAITICVALAGVSHFLMSWEGTRRETRRGALYVQGEMGLLDFLDSHTHAGEEVFVYPYQPIYYFVEDLRNPTRYSDLTYGFNSDAQFLEATRDLERKKVRYVVFDSLLSGEKLSGVFPAYRQPAKSQLIMEPYLEAHYRMVKDTGRFRILERR